MYSFPCADLFSVLANSNGAVESTDLAYFLSVTQQVRCQTSQPTYSYLHPPPSSTPSLQLARTLQEQLYKEWAGPKQLWRESLVHVRSAEDVEDEETDGGSIKRQWLSQFEFTKLFSSSPLPTYLGWMVLYHRMPSMEKGEWS